MNINKEYKKKLDAVRKYVKPYGYCIRFSTSGYVDDIDYRIQLFKGYVSQHNKVWETSLWYDCQWSNFDKNLKNLVDFFDKYCK